ncbi:BgTH12-02575 [Blumeria graminis f. sp. triticale]|uniref:BgTH12-02575 n=1 Tax=Blumeria graminis f. sp. triticale TaxID=1689686 RepID=A0A9W4DMU3_BLUGR|nr:BgTH12-02575 [Blumeria graminis f. sp. triticale]
MPSTLVSGGWFVEESKSVPQVVATAKPKPPKKSKSAKKAEKAKQADQSKDPKQSKETKKQKENKQSKETDVSKESKKPKESKKKNKNKNKNEPSQPTEVNPPQVKMAKNNSKVNTQSAVSAIKSEDEELRILQSHMELLRTSHTEVKVNQIQAAPIFTAPVLRHFRDKLGPYGFLAGISGQLDQNTTQDPRVFFNISAPSSAFICGSQGSGKSHSLSCLLENCLMQSYVSELESPLAALVFHYDKFSADDCGTPCEAAYLASNPNIKVNVLCSPSNIETIRRTYRGLNVQTSALRINETDLNTQRMFDLMAVNPENGVLPLYIHSISRILRELRIEQQAMNTPFSYSKFKRGIDECSLTSAQLAPLLQRLDTLESFMPPSQTASHRGQILVGRSQEKASLDTWKIKPGTLTIVDLSCPCVTAESACTLFNICLGLFLEQKTKVGRIIALDEAHKYMTSTSEAMTLTSSLLSSIRLQRHLGTRVFISTQEPTISPSLLDLCSITIVHRFTSPEWFRCLRQHLSALDQDQMNLYGDDDDDITRRKVTSLKQILAEIVDLDVGEALLFSPNAMVGINNNLLNQPGAPSIAEAATSRAQKLGMGYLRLKIRNRLTLDGGMSILAN